MTASEYGNDRPLYSGAVKTTASGLTFPTALAIGPDGALYVSNRGFAGSGAGEILRVAVPK